MKIILTAFLTILLLATPLFAQEEPMECDVLVRATDGSNDYKKGYPVSVKDVPCVWGSAEYLPNFIHLILTDCEASQVEHFLNGWQIKFEHTIVAENDAGYRIKVEVDPDLISASDIGKAEIKDSMQAWAEDLGFTVRNFSSSSMTFDVPKPWNLLQLKIDFADVFDDVLDIRRYYFSDSDVDGVVNDGGEMTLTRTQALNYIIDKLEE